LGMRMPVAILLSLVCGGIAAFGVGALSQNKRKRLFLQREEETQKSKLLTHLSLLSDAKKTAFFLSVFSQQNATQRFGPLKLTNAEAFYFLKLRFAPVTADDIAGISRLKTSKQKILLCNLIDEDAKRLCERLNIRIWTGNEIYSLIKSANALPERFLGEPTPQNKRKIRLRACFSKRNSRRFLVGGCLLLLSSLITPFPYYYLVFGSVLLLTAIVIRIFGYAD